MTQRGVTRDEIAETIEVARDFHPAKEVPAQRALTASELEAVAALADQIVARSLMAPSSVEIRTLRRLVREHRARVVGEEAGDAASPASPASSKHPGSSAGIHCHHDQHLREGGCPERLELARTTTEQPTHEDDYQQLMPALDEAAVALGWRTYQCVWWCPTHVVSKNLACKRCLSACPACSCVGGPLGDAVAGIDVETSEGRPS